MGTAKNGCKGRKPGKAHLSTIQGHATQSISQQNATARVIYKKLTTLTSVIYIYIYTKRSLLQRHFSHVAGPGVWALINEIRD